MNPLRSDDENVDGLFKNIFKYPLFFFFFFGKYCSNAGNVVVYICQTREHRCTLLFCRDSWEKYRALGYGIAD